MCMDYRVLNKITVKNKYPLSIIDDLLNRVSRSKFFSKINSRSRYHQIRIAEEDIHKTTFRTHYRHSKFKMLLFGLTNAPVTFQGIINKIFKEYLDDFVNVYIDNIIVFSKTFKEYREHSKIVLDKLKKSRLYDKISKCEFLKLEIEFLNYVISQDDIQVDSKKVQVVKD